MSPELRATGGILNAGHPVRVATLTRAMGVVSKIRETFLAVPVFAKVMGIALSLIVLFGVGTIWQLRITERKVEQAEHEGASAQALEEHLTYETAVITTDLTRIMLLLAILGLLLAWGLARILVHPLQELVQGVRAVQDGDYRTRVPVRARDETGDLAMAFNDMASALGQKEAARQRLLRELMQVGEEERKRLARELHDQSGQTLTALIAGLAALEAKSPDDDQRRRLAELRRLSEQTLEEVHNVSLALRPPLLDDVGLYAALQRHCETFSRRFAVNVSCSLIGMEEDERFPSETEGAIFRIVQEGLTNAVRHGRARSVKVVVQPLEKSVLTLVEDDGQGFDATNWKAEGLIAGHLGLLGMEERATLVGGSFCVESQPGSGTKLFVELPLAESSHG